MLHRCYVQTAVLPILKEVLPNERMLYMNHPLNLLRFVGSFIKLYFLFYILVSRVLATHLALIRRHVTPALPAVPRHLEVLVGARGLAALLVAGAAGRLLDCGAVNGGGRGLGVRSDCVSGAYVDIVLIAGAVILAAGPEVAGALVDIEGLGEDKILLFDAHLRVG